MIQLFCRFIYSLYDYKLKTIPFRLLLKLLDTDYYALVFGATGLVDWSVVAQLLAAYPAASAFARIAAISNRPVDGPDTYWPDGEPPDLRIVSGVDLRDDGLADQLRARVDGIGRVTHVFYFGWLPVACLPASWAGC